MLVPLSWLRDYVDLTDDLTPEQLTDRLTALGLKLEAITAPGQDITGPLVVGRVLSREPEPQKNGKTINWCTVDVGEANGTGEPQGIVCGAHNFDVDDLVVVILPGGVLPGGFEISARKTYGHVSAGMICSTRELGIGDDHDGILVLPKAAGEPGEDARPLLGLDEVIIDLEINPDRAYALSMRGVAREAGLGFGVAFTDPALREVPAANDQGYPVVVADSAGAPVFVTRTVTGFDPSAPTPDWLARRVRAAGIRSISLAVDVTNYVMLELGQPIHGYDGDKLAGPLGVRRASEGEKLTTLDGTTRTLSAEDLLITDDSGPIGLAGVMGGEHTELSPQTTTIVIEAAHFDPVSIFRTARRHKLPSEASKRFERGVDPTICAAAADRVAEILTTLGGGHITDGVTVVGQAPAPTTVTMAADLPARVTGMQIASDTVVRNLEAIGAKVSLADNTVTAVVPAWRPDLTDPFDLVEEVARIIGYDEVPSVLPQAPAGRGLTLQQRLRRRLGRTMAGAGFSEVLTFPFVGDDAFDKLGLPADDARRTTVRLANPLSSEEPAMTTTLLPGLLKVMARNVSRGTNDLAVFEAAPVTLPRDEPPSPILGVDQPPTEREWESLNAALPAQPTHLAIGLCGDFDRTGWWGDGRAASWSDALQAVRHVAAVLGATVTFESAEKAPWHPGRCARVMLGERVVGYAGELHPRACQAWGVPPRSAVAEIDVDLLLSKAVEVAAAPRFSTFPVAKEDVALVVPADLPSEDLAAVLRQGAGEMCESVRLFDVYTDDRIGAGRKSLAFALRFRAPDRTLTEGETAQFRDAAVALAAERFGAEQRA